MTEGRVVAVLAETLGIRAVARGLSAQQGVTRAAVARGVRAQGAPVVWAAAHVTLIRVHAVLPHVVGTLGRVVRGAATAAAKSAGTQPRAPTAVDARTPDRVVALETTLAVGRPRVMGAGATRDVMAKGSAPQAMCGAAILAVVVAVSAPGAINVTMTRARVNAAAGMTSAAADQPGTAARVRVAPVVGAGPIIGVAAAGNETQYAAMIGATNATMVRVAATAQFKGRTSRRRKCPMTFTSANWTKKYASACVP